MAWEDELIPMLRDMIGDTDAVQKYTDDDLESVVVTAAKLVNLQAPFIQSYRIIKEDGTITPDPTLTVSLDDEFANLIIVKAACIITQGDLIKKGSQAIRIVDGRSEIDLREAYRARLSIVEKTWCDQYKTDLEEYKRRVSRGEVAGLVSGAGLLGRQVTSPVAAWGGSYR